MKIERLLLGLFASFLMAGCSQNDDLPNGGEDNTIGKDSYISVKICSPKGLFGRATNDDDFADATGDEGQVSKAHFFFFDDNGNAVAVDGGKNYKEMTVNKTDDEDGDGSTESLVDAVVVLEKPTNIPTRMVVVLNWTYSGDALTLKNLTEELVEEGTALASTGFVMSNSVYYNDGVINATEVTSANFAESAEEAKSHPVNAYVERLAVKVTAALPTSTTDRYDSDKVAFDTGVTYTEDGNSTGTKIYAKILGWQLNTTNPKSYLVKQINEDWGTTPPFDDWNETNKYRSYWGESYTPTNGEEYLGKSFEWTGIADGMSAVDYCLENTTTTATKAVFKAQLCTWNDTGNKLEPLTVWQWYAEYYTTENDLLNDVLAQANAKIKELNGTTLESGNIKIKYADKSTPAGDFYKVTFVLADGVTDGDVGNSGKKYSDILKEIVPAKKWQDGATYYFTTIKHLNNKDALIRNHAYRLQVTEVKGLGTPANKPDDDPSTPDPEPEIPEPVNPSDTETYIAAEIDILSWRLVNNNVILGN